VIFAADVTLLELAGIETLFSAGSKPRRTSFGAK
jgi:hypothetical protein